MIYSLLSSYPLLIRDEKWNKMYHDNQRYRMHTISMSVDWGWNNEAKWYWGATINKVSYALLHSLSQAYVAPYKGQERLHYSFSQQCYISNNEWAEGNTSFSDCYVYTGPWTYNREDGAVVHIIEAFRECQCLRGIDRLAECDCLRSR